MLPQVFAASKQIFLAITVYVISNLSAPRAALAIAFDEVSSLHIWISVSSLANKNPVNSKSVLFRQIELNWINAPLDEPDDFIGLYLDERPEESGARPVSVHKLEGRTSGRLTTNYYLPMINFFNDTKGLPVRPHAAGLAQEEISYDIVTLTPHTGHNHRWHNYNTYGPKRDERHSVHHQLPRGKGASWQNSPALLKDECLGYCIAYHRQSRILATNCLSTSPNWMADSQATSRPLPSLMIPGTHNAGTYPRQLDKSALQMINKYQINQDESIFNQLVYGIRYLDLRVGHARVKQRPEELWIYHDIFRTDTSLDEVFEQVGRFLDLTDKEIIVMDFHRFTVGFQNENTQTQRERHAKLVDLLFKRLGQYIIPSYLGQHAPLNEYISLGKRLMVGYAGRSELLFATQTDHHSGMFALYSAAQPSPKKGPQVRDIHSGDDVESAASVSNSTTNHAEMQTDWRMGTRIYNKLKSLKLISRQFSKRSTTDNKDNKDDKPYGGSLSAQMSGNKYKKLERNNARPTAGPHNSPLKVVDLTNQQMAAQLVQANDDNGAEELNRARDEALSSLTSRVALLFPPVRHLWPNKDTLEGLAQYMNETTCRSYFGELRSMMVELTPTVFGAISDKYDGNRRLADLTNRPVTDWIRQRWLHCINIVSSDFFLGNDLIRLSIYANRLRLSNSHRQGDPNELGSLGNHCKSFRRIEHLLDKSRLASDKAQHAPLGHQSAPDSVEAGGRAGEANASGISEFVSIFKRIFNL